MKNKLILIGILFYIVSIWLCTNNRNIATVWAQSDSCTDGQVLTIDTVNKRYKCMTVSSGGLGSGGNVNMTVANASSTGTTVNRFAKLTGAPSTALITSTSDTENAIGVVTSGAGTTGSATIAILGQVNCDFDNATTAGNYVTISAIAAGKCHDAGSSYPTSGAAYGRVLSTNGASGTFSMELMTPDIAFQNAGNGKSKPGGSTGDFQINGTGNVFSGDALTGTANLKATGGTIQFTATQVIPSATNTITLGSSTRAWSSVLSVNLFATSAGSIGFNGGSGPTFTSGATAGATGALTFVYNATWAGAIRNFTASSGNNNDPDFGTSSYFYRISPNAAGSALTGARTIEQTGEVHELANVGSALLTLTNNSSSSSAGQRWLSASNLSLQLPPNQRTQYIYDGTTNNIRVGKYESSETMAVATQFDKTNTTLADITGLTQDVTASRTYNFTANLYYDADATGGGKFAIGGTATATSIIYQINTICNASNTFVINSRQTALAGSAGQAGCTAGHTQITGTITVNAAGTLTVQFAQNAANGTSSVLVGSSFYINNIR